MLNNKEQTLTTKLLSAGQVAKNLGLSIPTIRRFIKNRKLKASKIGKSYRIKEQDYLDLTQTDQEKNRKEKPIRIPDKPDFLYTKNPNHLRIFPGINSEVLEAIIEMSEDIPAISELKQIISLHAKDCLELLNKIEAEGVKDSQTAVNLLLVDEAIRNLTIRRSLFKNLIDKTGVVLLPLPPHLSDSFLALADHDLVFISDEEIPPHLKHVHYKNLTFLDPETIDNSLKNIESVITEGYLENNNIYVRRNSAILIYQLCKKGLKDVFIHNIPHIPPRSNFVELNTGGELVDIAYI